MPPTVRTYKTEPGEYASRVTTESKIVREAKKLFVNAYSRQTPPIEIQSIPEGNGVILYVNVDPAEAELMYDFMVRIEPASGDDDAVQVTATPYDSTTSLTDEQSDMIDRVMVEATSGAKTMKGGLKKRKGQKTKRRGKARSTRKKLRR